jgi:hypothetical protein
VSESGIKRRKYGFYAGVAALGIALALPVIAQRGPTSLLPPGFGEPDPETPTAQEIPDDDKLSTPSSSEPQRQSSSALNLDLSGGIGASDSGDIGNGSDVAEVVELTPEELAAQQAKYDLPQSARRSLDLVGPLTPATGGIDVGAFGAQSGQFLAALMKSARAPFVSRWGSILLRRALLSATKTPADINGADWVAERAWLLVRMGEADAARQLVQSVDSDRFTQRLDAVAMQTYLASADMAGLCPIYQRAQDRDDTPGWLMVNAMCASFNGEQGTASAVLNQAQRRGKVRGIDYRLSEKMVGAGANSRRSVKIEWDGVEKLTAWRFGLATATNVDIPAPLLNSAGARVRAWQARAPMLSLATKQQSVEVAARLGVFSASSLLDYYSQLSVAETVPEGFERKATALRTAYTAAEPAKRIEAMRSLWTNGTGVDYVGLLSVARASASLPVVNAEPIDTTHLIAAMLSAGYDSSAARWFRATTALDTAEGSTGWAMLAVGAPGDGLSISADRASDYASANGRRGQMLIAGLIGLGRLRGSEATNIAEDAGLNLAKRSRWIDAISTAARYNEKGTVSLLAAIGMQADSWQHMTPLYLFHIISALRHVGLEAEARMIAAEAIMRT